MDMYRIHDMLEDVSEAATTELAKGAENVNTKEFGEVVDMIKDLSEAEKNKMEACYYKTLIEVMEESDYGEDYDEYGPLERRGYRGGGGRSGGGRGGNRGGGNRSGGRGGRRSYEEMWEDPRYMEYMNERMGYSNGAYGGGSRGQSSGGQGGQGRGYSQGGQQQSRYGYSHDDYMNERKMYSSTDPESMKKRAKMIDEHMDDMYEMFKEEVQDMTPEEKQMWKSKLNKIINL